MFEISYVYCLKNQTTDLPIFITARRQNHFLNAHANFFEDVGGVYNQIVYDNTKVAVAKFVGRSEKKPTDELLKLSIYYNFKFKVLQYRKSK